MSSDPFFTLLIIVVLTVVLRRRRWGGAMSGSAQATGMLYVETQGGDHAAEW